MIPCRLFTGCVSCFGCKRAPNEGRCVYKDGLALVLAAIRDADGLILGTPNYLGDVTAGFRALYERLIFQSLTYRNEPWSYNKHLIPGLFIMTSTSPEEYYQQAGYDQVVSNYQRALSGMVGPMEVLICGDTLQVKDYGRFNWTMFDSKAKQKRHNNVFPLEKQRAFQMGSKLVADRRN